MTDLILQDLRKLLAEDLSQILCSERMKMFGDRGLRAKGAKQAPDFQILRCINGAIRRIRRKRQPHLKS